MDLTEFVAITEREQVAYLLKLATEKTDRIAALHVQDKALVEAPKRFANADDCGDHCSNTCAQC